ncbi:hypothetical protein C8J57DRAFT_1253667 [Mycena rebaudengoi]|nr:hypothetical protein C8J57DRAFT_1253667 [Mycena rebaudengoi]
MYKVSTKPATGPPQALISRINHLQNLLKHLPNSLPLNPPQSNYQFYVDEDRVADAESVFPVAARALELSFGTWKRDTVVKFEERGARLKALGPFLKAVVKRMTPREREDFQAAWIDRLVNAAKESGAVIPSHASKARGRESGEEESSELPPLKKSRRNAPIIIDSDDEALPASIPIASAPKQTIASTAIPSTSNVNLVTNAQATLATMGWQNWVPGAKEAHLKEASRLQQERAGETMRKKERDLAAKKEREQALTAERQRQFRIRKKAAKDAEEELSDDDNVHVALMRGADATAHEHQVNVAETSRAGTQGWQDKRNGREGGAVQKRAATVNYFHPFLWDSIDKQMRLTGWSPSATAQKLQRMSPLYKGLQKGTISKWRVKGKNEWQPATLERIIQGKAITASEQQPKLLDKFKVSERYVRTFFASVMDWTPRKATRQARHIPEDAPNLIKRTFFRLRYAILTGRIPPELIVNANQAGNYLLPSSGHTFHDRGAKQVDVVAKDEKRAYTMMLASTPSGDFLPIQAVWAGKTRGSLPDDEAEGYEDVMDRGFIFSSAKSKKKTSHFSTFSTMEEWVRDIIAPWCAKILQSRPDLDDDQLMVVYIDIYPVHIGEEFRTHIFSSYPYLILIFVPGGCTGLLQPADVGLQRVAKHLLKQDSLDYLVDIFRAQSVDGIAPKDVKFPTSLPVLRNATVRGLTPDGQKIVKQAWRKCEVLGTPWNLSEDCLTAKDSEKALREFLREDTFLATEIANRCGATHLANVLTTSSEPTDSNTPPPEESHADFDTHDDSDIPLNTVVQDALGINVECSPSSAFTVSCASRMDEMMD